MFYGKGKKMRMQIIWDSFTCIFYAITIALRSFCLITQNNTNPLFLHLVTCILSSLIFSTIVSLIKMFFHRLFFYFKRQCAISFCTHWDDFCLSSKYRFLFYRPSTIFIDFISLVLCDLDIFWLIFFQFDFEFIYNCILLSLTILSFLGNQSTLCGIFYLF